MGPRMGSAQEPKPKVDPATKKVLALIKKRRPYLKYIDASNAVLSNINLDGVDFSHAHLCGADFSGSSLKNTIFAFTNLQGCNFKNADLTEANLERSLLNGASFVGANLTNAKFRLSSFNMIASIDFAGAIGVVTFPKVGSRDDTLLVSKYHDVLYFKTGCFWGNEEEFRQAVCRKHDFLSPHRWRYLICIKKAKIALSQ